MAHVNPTMRLKVRGDTYFLPDGNGGVYFRNHDGSFRMEGKTIDQWIEKLIPVLNGEYTLEDLTDGLPDAYKRQVYEIAEVLVQNGFVRDVSHDEAHQLSERILQKYASQIEFLDSLGGSGAYRFQMYRQANVVAVGSGPTFVALIASLLESGLQNIHTVITDSVPTNRQRVAELMAHARKTDPEVAVQEVSLQKQEGRSLWKESLEPFDWVLYVSQEAIPAELRELQTTCREEGKHFLPAICVEQVGMAGPLVHPDSEGCWESAWRRLHRSAICKDPELHTVSSTASAMLVNVMAFELLKSIAGVAEAYSDRKFYLLDLETLEGNWHSFLPHPKVTGLSAIELLPSIEWITKRADQREANGLIPFFSRLTSEMTGIFHFWDAGDLQQLPLAQCHVQVADPLAEEQAELLPDIVCTGLTHGEARREAGLAGLEAYVSRLIEQAEVREKKPHECIGVGAGETFAEGVCRGLLKCLTRVHLQQQEGHSLSLVPAQFLTVEDERCRYELQALTTMQGEPAVATGEDVHGFPVIWVGTSDNWYAGVGLNRTMAFRNALQQAIRKTPDTKCFAKESFTVSAALVDEKKPDQEQPSFLFPACEQELQSDVLQSALQVLKQQRKQLLVFNLALEPFLKGELAGVFGVLVRGEES